MYYEGFRFISKGDFSDICSYWRISGMLHDTGDNHLMQYILRFRAEMLFFFFQSRGEI